MNFSNPLWGTISILTAVVLFFFAYRSAKNENYRASIILIFLAGLLLRFFAGMDFYLHSWDERYHALAAKNMLAHMFVPTLYERPLFDYDYREWTNNHIWVHKPPLTLWLIMVSLKIFGTNEIAVRLPSIILSSIGIILTYYIGKEFFRHKVGLLAAFFYAINGFLIELAVGRHPTDHPDILFTFFVELGVFLSLYYLRYRSFAGIILVGLATGCAVLTKWLPGFIVIGLFFVLLLQRDNWKQALAKCVVAAVVAGIIVAPWQVYIYTVFPREAAWESYFNYRHLFEPLDGHDGTVFYHVALLPRIFGELIYIPLLMFFVTCIKGKCSFSGAALAFWLVVPYVFFSIVATKMPGYVMLSAPAIFLILAWAFWSVKENLGHSWYRKAKIALLALLVLLPIRYSIERVKPFQNIDRNPAWAIRLRELKFDVSQPRAVVFNVEHYVEAMFYTNVTAYPFIPSKEQIQQLIKKGYSVYAFDDPSLPSEMLCNKDIIILRTHSTVP